jgi:Tfp pilus assembly protein PilN
VSIQTATRLTTLPRVNLLPPEIGERKRLQQMQVGVVATVLVAVAAVVFLDMQGAHNVNAAKQRVTAATSDNARLTHQLATYRDVKTTAAELAASEATLAQATSTQIRWSSYLADFSEVLPKTTWLTNMTMTEQLAPGSLTGPAQAAGNVGTLSFQGVALKYGNLAEWLDSLQPVDGLADVYFSTATEQYIGTTKTVTFAGSANLSADALCPKAGSC